MKPAWRVSFDVRAFDRQKMVTGWKWHGECQDGRFRVRVSAATDPLVVGSVDVTSYQPNRSDAVDDALRGATDLCNVLSVAFGGVLFSPVSPPLQIEALEGARSGGGVGMSDAAFLSANVDVSGRIDQLEAAERLDDDPVLRANTDTFLVASREEDGPARVISFYRIYEGYAQSLIGAEPPLFDPDQRRTLVDAAMSAATDLDDEACARLRSSLTSSVGRMHTRSRKAILSERFTELLGRPVPASTVDTLDGLRGRFAHTPTEALTTPSPEAEQLLFEVVWALLKHDLGLAAAN
ncbi:MAG: hypothetical protein M3N98_08850 [Actinomycetota bacterium]|nr:hypothetical protein [Actinomycetota bacterium]